jgi:hypothetical protein
MDNSFRKTVKSKGKFGFIPKWNNNGKFVFALSLLIQSIYLIKTINQNPIGMNK